MKKYIERSADKKIERYRSIFPAVAVLGPRQCGKTTLARKIFETTDNAVYLDLQDPSDYNKLTDPELFFQSNEDNVIFLDEIQLKPELFSKLRSIIDKNRINGKFILLGSASRDLIQKSSETLAGRIGYIRLTPFTATELRNSGDLDLNSFWLRGGFPESFFAQDDEASSFWRNEFIRTFIERDIPQLGILIPAIQLRRFLTMCAHLQGQTLNLSKFSESLSMTHPTARRYVDLLEQAFVLRTLQPFEANVKKRIVKSPKIYVRDTGILHQLLGIKNFNELLGHPEFGASWEGMVIENIISEMPDLNFFFFRTSTGDEIDLILETGNSKIAVECKASTAPKVKKGFYRALDIVKPDKSFIAAPIKGKPYGIAENITVTGLTDLLDTLKQL